MVGKTANSLINKGIALVMCGMLCCAILCGLATLLDAQHVGALQCADKPGFVVGQSFI